MTDIFGKLQRQARQQREAIEVEVSAAGAELAESAEQEQRRLEGGVREALSAAELARQEALGEIRAEVASAERLAELPTVSRAIVGRVRKAAAKEAAAVEEVVLEAEEAATVAKREALGVLAERVGEVEAEITEAEAAALAELDTAEREALEELREFHEAHVQLPTTGEWVSKEEFGKLEPLTQKLLEAHGTAGYEALIARAQADLMTYTADGNVDVVTALSEHPELEATLYNIGVSAEDVAGAKEFIQENARLPSGEWVPESWLVELPSAEQELLRERGTKAWQNEFYVELSTGELVSKVEFNAMPEGLQAHVMEGGAKAIEALEALPAEEKFRKYSELGLIPEGSAYIGAKEGMPAYFEVPKGKEGAIGWAAEEYYKSLMQMQKWLETPPEERRAGEEPAAAIELALLPLGLRELTAAMRSEEFGDVWQAGMERIQGAFGSAAETIEDWAMEPAPGWQQLFKGFLGGAAELAVGVTSIVFSLADVGKEALADRDFEDAGKTLLAIPAGMALWAMVVTPKRWATSPVSGAGMTVGNLVFPFAFKAGISAVRSAKTVVHPYQASPGVFRTEFGLHPIKVKAGKGLTALDLRDLMSDAMIKASELKERFTSVELKVGLTPEQTRAVIKMRVPRERVSGIMEELNRKGVFEGDVFDAAGRLVETTDWFVNPLLEHGGVVRRSVRIVVYDENGRVLLHTDRAEPTGLHGLPGGSIDPLNITNAARKHFGPSRLREQITLEEVIRDHVYKECGIELTNIHIVDPYLGMVNPHSLPGSIIVTARAKSPKIDLTKSGATPPETSAALWWDGKSRLPGGARTGPYGKMFPGTKDVIEGVTGWDLAHIKTWEPRELQGMLHKARDASYSDRVRSNRLPTNAEVFDAGLGYDGFTVHLTRENTPLHMVEPRLVYHVTDNGMPWLRELAEKGYVEIKATRETGLGTWGTFFDLDAVYLWLRESATKGMPEQFRPLIIVNRLGPNELVNRSMTISGESGVFQTVFKTIGRNKVVESEVMATTLGRLYPTTPNLWARSRFGLMKKLFGEEATAEFTTRWRGPTEALYEAAAAKPYGILKHGQSIPMVMMRTAKAVEAGFEAPRLSSFYAAKLWALARLVEDAATGKIRPRKVTITGRYSDVPPFRGTRETYRIKTELHEIQRTLEAEAEARLRAKEFKSPEEYSRALEATMEEVARERASKLLEEGSDVLRGRKGYYKPEDLTAEFMLNYYSAMHSLVAAAGIPPYDLETSTEYARAFAEPSVAAPYPPPKVEEYGLAEFGYARYPLAYSPIYKAAPVSPPATYVTLPSYTLPTFAGVTYPIPPTYRGPKYPVPAYSPTPPTLPPYHPPPSVAPAYGPIPLLVKIFPGDVTSGFVTEYEERRKKPLEPSALEGAVTFRFGMRWVTVLPPYANEDIFYTDMPVFETIQQLDVGRPHETLQVIHLSEELPEIPQEIVLTDESLGMFDVRIYNYARDIEFVRKPPWPTALEIAEALEGIPVAEAREYLEGLTSKKRKRVLELLQMSKRVPMVKGPSPKWRGRREQPSVTELRTPENGRLTTTR